MNRSATVLIADDDPIVLRMLDESLRRENYNTITATDGEKALAAAIENTPDLILLDVMMPGIDGYEVCRRLRSHRVLAEVPIIIITFLDDRDSRLRGLEAGADDFISKPLDLMELKARVRTITRLGRYRRLLQERSKFERVVEFAPNGILIVNGKGAIKLANPAALKMLDAKTSDAIIGNNLFRFIAPEHYDECRSRLDGVLGNASSVSQMEAEIVSLNSRLFPAEIDYSAFVWDDEPTGQIILRDVTEKKKLEKKLLRAQRMESIGMLAGGIAHDLNNVLTPIIISLQLLRMTCGQKEERLLDTLETTAHRGAELVKQILSFGRGLEEKRFAVQPRHIVTEMEKITKEIFPKTIAIEAVLSKDLWMVLADPTQIYQVLMNLCVNARDAMQNGGKLRIAAENIFIDEHSRQIDSKAAKGPYVAFTVSDTGDGIDPEALGQIFDPFFTTKEPGKGTGLGLHTVAKITANHGGFVKVYSELARGTQFKIYLPAMESEESKQIEESSLELPSGNGELIMVIDDEASIREIAKATLEAYNYRVLTAGDGMEAITVFAKHSKEIELVLTDLSMPIMDGMNTARAIQKVKPQIKIIVLSGLPSEERRIEALGAGVTAVLSKPYTTVELFNAIESILNR